jgi:hypothetical protein
MCWICWGLIYFDWSTQEWPCLFLERSTLYKSVRIHLYWNETVYGRVGKVLLFGKVKWWVLWVQFLCWTLLFLSVFSLILFIYTSTKHTFQCYFYLPVCLSIYLSVYLSMYFISHGNIYINNSFSCVTFTVFHRSIKDL